MRSAWQNPIVLALVGLAFLNVVLLATLVLTRTAC